MEAALLTLYSSTGLQTAEDTVYAMRSKQPAASSSRSGSIAVAAGKELIMPQTVEVIEALPAFALTTVMPHGWMLGPKWNVEDKAW